jgi:hypothetical protein
MGKKYMVFRPVRLVIFIFTALEKLLPSYLLQAGFFLG